jgi:hypothetical protein
MMNRDVMGRQMFANGGPAMPQPEMGMDQMAMMAQEQGVDPAQLQGALEMAQGQMQQIDNAENYEQVINGIRGDQQPLEARYAELTSVVGQEDSQATPESVLTLLQPVMQMAAVDQGIGGLAAEEMTAPIEGPMAEGIMSTVGMGEPDPVNFSQGGPVIHMAEGGEPNAKYAEQLEEIQRQRGLYASVLGTENREAALADQKRMTKAQMLFDIAQGGFALASPTDRNMSFAERLASSFNPVVGNIGARAGEFQKFKQGQEAEQRALDLQAIGQAQNVIAARTARDFTAEQTVKDQEFREKVAARNRAHEKDMQDRRLAAEVKRLDFDAEVKRLQAIKENEGKIKLIGGGYFDLKNITSGNKSFLLNNKELALRLIEGDSSLGTFSEIYEDALVKQVMGGKEFVEGEGIIPVAGQPLTEQQSLVLAVVNPNLLEQIRQNYDMGIGEDIPDPDTARQVLRDINPNFYEKLRAVGVAVPVETGGSNVEDVLKKLRPKIVQKQPYKVGSPDYNAQYDIEARGGTSEATETIVIEDSSGELKVDLGHPVFYKSRETGPKLTGMYPQVSGGSDLFDLTLLKEIPRNKLQELGTLGGKLKGNPFAPERSKYLQEKARARAELIQVSNTTLKGLLEGGTSGGRMLKQVQEKLMIESDKLLPGQLKRSDEDYVSTLDTIIDDIARVIVANAKKVPEYTNAFDKNSYRPKEVQETRDGLNELKSTISDLLIIRETFALGAPKQYESFRVNIPEASRSPVAANILKAKQGVNPMGTASFPAPTGFVDRDKK